MANENDITCGESTAKLRSHDWTITPEGRPCRRPREHVSTPLPPKKPVRRQWYQSLNCAKIINGPEEPEMVLCPQPYGHTEPCAPAKTFRELAAENWKPEPKPEIIPPQPTHDQICAQVGVLVREGKPFDQAIDEVLGDNTEPMPPAPKKPAKPKTPERIITPREALDCIAYLRSFREYLRDKGHDTPMAPPDDSMRFWFEQEMRERISSLDGAFEKSVQHYFRMRYDLSEFLNQRERLIQSGKLK